MYIHIVQVLHQNFWVLFYSDRNQSKECINHTAKLGWKEKYVYMVNIQIWHFETFKNLNKYTISNYSRIF